MNYPDLITLERCGAPSLLEPRLPPTRLAKTAESVTVLATHPCINWVIWVRVERNHVAFLVVVFSRGGIAAMPSPRTINNVYN